MADEVVFKRRVEIGPKEVSVSIALYGIYKGSATVAEEIAKALGLPHTRVVSKMEQAVQEFYDKIKEQYGERKLCIDGLEVCLGDFNTVAEAKEFIKFVTKSFEETIAKAVKELKKEENFDKLREWLIKDYAIKL